MSACANAQLNGMTSSGPRNSVSRICVNAASAAGFSSAASIRLASAKKPGSGSALAMPTHFSSSAMREAKNRHAKARTKNAMRARPVVLAQKDVKRDQCAGTTAAFVARECLVQNASKNRIATINDATSSTSAPGIAARKSVINPAPANHASDHTATRANSFALRGSWLTGGKTRGDEITVANSTQLKITSG